MQKFQRGRYKYAFPHLHCSLRRSRYCLTIDIPLSYRHNLLPHPFFHACVYIDYRFSNMQISHLFTLQALGSLVLAAPYTSGNAIEQSSASPAVEMQIVGVPLVHQAKAAKRATAEKRASYTPSVVPSDYASQVIYHHNIHRQNHSAVNLVYSQTLASYARTLASSCSYGHNTYVIISHLQGRPTSV